ncbi:hypothetical protein [Alteromonas sp. H39]|uniref:hypothetical protein n=1 Tax=Alteromonas sp. H39 TaxID=3389876 RepID=UPI0039E1C7E4
MNWGEPKLKPNIHLIPPYEFDVKKRLPLSTHSNPSKALFLDILESRSSRRQISAINNDLLGQFLFLSNRTKQVNTNDLGIIIEKKNHASAGAMSCVHIVFTEISSEKWYVYNSRTHSKDELKLTEGSIFKNLKEEAKSFISGIKDGVMLWYVADITRLSCKYTRPETLALRESGIIAATHNLVAEYLGLSYCQLGLNGFNEASCLSNERHLFGVGMAFLGTTLNYC